VIVFLTKEAVRLALPGYADDVEVPRGAPVARLFRQNAESQGELYVRPVCFDARKLDDQAIVDNARLAGATPLWEWIGDGATVLSYWSED
jgi:predicted peroxiredoxin